MPHHDDQFSRDGLAVLWLIGPIVLIAVCVIAFVLSLI